MERIIDFDTEFGRVPVLISQSRRFRRLSFVARKDRIPEFQARVPETYSFSDGTEFVRKNIDLLEQYMRKHPDRPAVHTEQTKEAWHMPDVVSWPLLGGDFKIKMESIHGNRLTVVPDLESRCLYYRLPENTDFPGINAISKTVLVRCARPVLYDLICETADRCALECPVKFNCRVCLARWGSWGADATIMLNALLLFTGKETVQSVIIHELCHRAHPDHSKAFWHMLYRYCPDYDRHHEILKTLMDHIDPVWKKHAC